MTMRHTPWNLARPNTIASAARLALLVSVLGVLGCGDGVERGSVQVPERTVVSTGGGQSVKTGARPARRAAPDTKVVTPGGKKM
jgi:hypothetical protein